jgi:hypothetical protein
MDMQPGIDVPCLMAGTRNRRRMLLYVWGIGWKNGRLLVNDNKRPTQARIPLVCQIEDNTMPTDRYTKAVLTIIAGALIALVAQNAVPVSRAAGEIQRVAICDLFGPACAGVEPELRRLKVTN